MTSVDVAINNEATGERWSLSNGLNGPASQLAFAIWDELMAGRAEGLGPVNVAQFSARLSGELLAEVIARTDLTGWAYRSSTDVDVLRTQVSPDDSYVVSYIES